MFLETNIFNDFLTAGIKLSLNDDDFVLTTYLFLVFYSLKCR